MTNNKEVQRWFCEEVTFDGEPYVIDLEQAAAIADESLNAIVVARAGSGKTRTLVAKIVYLIAKCEVKPEEIMAFVFNANAADEINERLEKMYVNGVPVVTNAKIASTFHAFSRRVVYKICKGEKRCGRILAGEKDGYVLAMVKRMMRNEKWRNKVIWFLKGVMLSSDMAGERGKVVENIEVLSTEEIERFAMQMTQFINRAQQKYLGGDKTVGEVARDYLALNAVEERERLFVELGVECFRRYHWYLLDSKRGLNGFSEYGTDFNLIVSWASKMIASGRVEINELLGGKKYILVDEYQDFSQLFLAAVEAIKGVAKEARLFVVGDDWQAINRFAGSDVEYFKNFEKYFSDGCSKYEIGTNYRCHKRIVETARNFMARSMKEKGSFRAFSKRKGEVVLVNPKETEMGFALVPYDKRVSSEDRIIRSAVEKMGGGVVKKAMVRYLKTVIRIVKMNLVFGDILILHRNNEMNVSGVSLGQFGKGLKWGLDKLGVLEEERFDEKIRIMTMHKSKGLEADVVIIMEADEGVIPKLHPDTVLYSVFGETNEVALDDQKRLFYVAMTRAKKRLYIIHDGVKGDGFAKYLGKGVNEW